MYLHSCFETSLVSSAHSGQSLNNTVMTDDEQHDSYWFSPISQIDTMLNLYELLMEMSQKMEAEVLKTLLVFPNLLVFLYDRWIKAEDSHIEELQCSLDKNVDELQEKYQKVKAEEMEEIAA